MSTITGKWKAEWERKKAYFETQTGKKAPSKGFMAKISTGKSVSSAFDSMDKAYANMIKVQSGPKRVKGQDAFGRSITAAKKAAASYIKVLDTAMGREVTDDTQVPISKPVKPLLKILKADIDLCITSAEGQLEAARALNDAQGRPDPRKYNDMKQFTSRLPGTLKQGLMWCKMQEQNPDVRAFNEGVNKATRDVTQNLNNIYLLMDPRSREARKAKAFLDLLDPWADKGKKLKVPDGKLPEPGDDTFAEVIKTLKDLKKTFAAIATWQNGMKVEDVIDQLI